MSEPTPNETLTVVSEPLIRYPVRYPVGTSVEIRVVVPSTSWEQFVMLDPHRDMAEFAARFETEEP